MSIKKCLLLTINNEILSKGGENMDIKSQDNTALFGKRLKHLRIIKDWSQGDLAAKLNIDTQRISKIERGITKPPLEILPKLSKIFEVDLDYLITGNSHIKNEVVRNPELIARFQEVDRLPKRKQDHIIALMDAFIKEQKFEELVKQ